MKEARTSRHPWLVACDANMNRTNFKKSLWYKRKHMFIEAPGEGLSTCRSKGPNDEFIERTYDCVIASQSLRSKIKNTEDTIEDFQKERCLKKLSQQLVEGRCGR